MYVEENKVKVNSIWRYKSDANAHIIIVDITEEKHTKRKTVHFKYLHFDSSVATRPIETFLHWFTHVQ